MKNCLITYLGLFIFFVVPLQATTYHGNPSNYKSFIPQLLPGDSLLLAPGIYKDRLKLVDVMGEENNPIVIMGDGDIDEVVFVGNACCNTVSLTRCAWLKLENFTIDGKFIKYIDAVKAEGSSGNWTHHITLEGLKIIGHGNDQQTVGISTKCPSWNWVIRRNIIIEAGTGIYLGNSDGEKPFVNGLVEYNLIMNTVGYNMQIKRQNDNTRNVSGMPQQGRTIIRYNVFSKAQNASTGGNARPNLLVGDFPPNTAGKDDHYEIYGNFFWQNPVEKLFQGTGNVRFYNNVLVNEHAGGGGIQIQKHQRRAPKNIYIFNNTLLTKGRPINFYQPDLSYEQRVEGNVVFSSLGIRNAPYEKDNLVKDLSEAEQYLVNPVFDIDEVDMSPLQDALVGKEILSSRYMDLDRYDRDFEGLLKDWSVWGAYSRSGDVNWDLKLERRPEVEVVTTRVNGNTDKDEEIIFYPNLVMGRQAIHMKKKGDWEEMQWYDGNNTLVFEKQIFKDDVINVPDLPAGIYVIVFKAKGKISVRRIVIQ